MNHYNVGDEICEEHKNYTRNGVCSNCGACCSNTLPLTKKDVIKLKKYIRKHDIKPISHAPSVLMQIIIDAICPFRDNINEKCIIYDARPTICRLYQCDKTMADAIEMVKSGAMEKARTYDVRSLLYGDGSLGLGSVMTLQAGERQLRKQIQDVKVMYDEQGKSSERTKTVVSL